MDANAARLDRCTTPPHDPQALWTRNQLAARLQVTSRALEKWAAQGYGPRPVRLSARCVRYRPEDVARFLREQTRPAA